MRLLEPMKTTPLSDLGSGENPFGLKKKLDFWNEIIDIVFAPPRSVYSFEVFLPRDSILEFGTGIVRDKNYDQLAETMSQASRDVRFSVELQTREGNSFIFEKNIPLPPKKKSRTRNFSKHRIDLPAQQQPARLTFMTGGAEMAFSFWHNPVIYTKGRSSRGIILISLDTLRADHLGCYGYQRPTSPNIDALAEDSVLFQHTYAASNWTLPSHVSLLTGLSTLSHQVYHPRERISSSTVMLAEILRQRHFFCSAITGAVLVSSAYGFSRGFDTYRQIEGFIGFENSAGRVSRAAADWLAKNGGKDFFLFLHTYQVHDPYSCPPPYNAMFLKENSRWKRLNLLRYLGGKKGSFKELPEEKRENIIGLYDGEIRYTDERLIGPLVEELHKLGLYDRTMIVLTSDHGEEFYEHGAWLHHNSLYDESIRVPLIIKFPRSQFRGRSLRTLVRQIDIMPTVLEGFGIEAPGWKPEGRSLLPVINGKEEEDRIFLADTDFRDIFNSLPEGKDSSKIWLPNKIAMGVRKEKFLFSQALGGEAGRFFSSLPQKAPVMELYNLEADPGEKINLTSQDLKSAREMVRRIQEIYKNFARRKSEGAKIDDKLEEQLRALGYIR